MNPLMRGAILFVIKNNGYCDKRIAHCSRQNCPAYQVLNICMSGKDKLWTATLIKECMNYYKNNYGEQSLRDDLVEALV